MTIRQRHLIVLVAYAFLLPVVAVAGFAAGRTSRPTVSQASRAQATTRAAAYHRADETASASAARVGAAHGRAAGEQPGDSAGAKAGTRDGARLLARRRAAQAVAAAAARARSATTTGGESTAGTGCPGDLVPEGTEACVLPGTQSVGGQSAGCGGDPYSTPSRSGGCIGPAAPPSPANAGPATNCPPGQVPVGSAGACAPSASQSSIRPASRSSDT